MLRRVGHYGIFFAISVAAHWLALGPFAGGAKPKADPREAVAAMMEISEIAKQVEAVKDEIAKKAADLEKSLDKKAPDAPADAPAKAEEPGSKGAAPAAPVSRSPDPKLERPKPVPVPNQPAPPIERKEGAPRKPDAPAPFVATAPPDASPKPDPRVAELEKKLAEAQADRSRAEKQAAAAEQSRASAAAQAAEEKAALAREAELAKADAKSQIDLAVSKAAAAEQAKAEATAQAEQAKRQAEQAERQAEETRTRAEREEKDLAGRLAELEDGGRFAAAASSVDALKVPRIRFTGAKSEDDYNELQRFYGMKVIVFPESRRFAALYDLASGAIEVVEDKTYLQSFEMRRALVERGSYWDTIADRVGRKLGVSGESLNVATIFPHRTARYLGWKELEVCRKAGVNPQDIATAVCSYERRQNGTWIVKVIELLPFSGHPIAVKDFEG